MKIGEYKVKRNYNYVQIISDVISAAVLFYMTIGYLDFSDTYFNTFKYFDDEATRQSFITQWAFTFVWAALILAVIAVSVVLTLKSRKMPKKYRIDEANVQQYHDIYVNAIHELRIPVYLIICEASFFHQQVVSYQTPSFQIATVLCALLLIVVIIRFAMRKIKLIETPVDESSHEIVEG